jgi:hypothetical protein
MIDAERLPAVHSIRRPTWRSIIAVAAWVAAVLLGGVAVAFLVATGRWYLALGVLLAVPMAVVVVRRSRRDAQGGSRLDETGLLEVRGDEVTELRPLIAGLTSKARKHLGHDQPRALLDVESAKAAE